MPFRLRHLTIFGVGLIGGSLAAAVRKAIPDCHITGVGRDPARLRPLLETGCLNEVHSHGSIAVRSADLVVFCTPVDRIVDGVRAVAADCPHGAILTDAGSVKAPICDALGTSPAAGVEFLGSHPLAGSERRGWEAAQPDLFRNRVCVLTPQAENSPAAIEFVRRFWETVGMQVRLMGPAAHDRTLALTSHLPHWLASSLAGLLDEEHRPFTATGFRDTTRIASGDPELWAAIFLANRTALLEVLDRHRQMLVEYQTALVEEDRDTLIRLLAAAKFQRDQLRAD